MEERRDCNRVMPSPLDEFLAAEEIGAGESGSEGDVR